MHMHMRVRVRVWIALEDVQRHGHGHGHGCPSLRQRLAVVGVSISVNEPPRHASRRAVSRELIRTNAIDCGLVGRRISRVRSSGMNVLSPRRGPCPSYRARLSRVSNALGDRARHATGRAAEVKKETDTQITDPDTRQCLVGYVDDEVQDRQAKCKDGLGGGYQTEGGRRGGGGGELRTERHQKSRRLRPVRLSLPESPSACFNNLPASPPSRSHRQ